MPAKIFSWISSQFLLFFYFCFCFLCAHKFPSVQHTPRVASATKWRPTRTNPIYYSSITFSYLLRHWPRLLLPLPPSSCYSTLADAKCVLLDELSVRLFMCATGCVCVCVACLPCCVQLRTNFDLPHPRQGDVVSRFALQFQASISAFFMINCI